MWLPTHAGCVAFLRATATEIFLGKVRVNGRALRRAKPGLSKLLGQSHGACSIKCRKDRSARRVRGRRHRWGAGNPGLLINTGLWIQGMGVKEGGDLTRFPCYWPCLRPPAYTLRVSVVSDAALQIFHAIIIPLAFASEFHSTAPVSAAVSRACYLVLLQVWKGFLFPHHKPFPWFSSRSF